MKKLFSFLNFKNLRTKILFGFSIVIVLAILLSSYTIYSISNMNKELNEIMDKELTLLITDEQLTIDTANKTSLVRGYLLYNDPQYKKEFESNLELNKELEGRALQLSDAKELQTLIDKRAKWNAFAQDVFTAYENGYKEKAMEIMQTSVRPLSTELMADSFKLSSKRETDIRKLGDEIKENGSLTITLGIIISVLVIVLGIIVAMFTASTIVKPIRTVMSRMKLIATGDLNHEPLETKLRDEVGQLVTSTNDMGESMRDIMVKINDVSSTVSTHSEELMQSANEVQSGTEQISTTMEELASGSETQASQSGELSQMMTTYIARIEEVNENVVQVQDESTQVFEVTNEGSELMNSSMNQMENIHEKSCKMQYKKYKV
ncbi:MCP four helix bundle domain-containing protein [Virgibacillus soli]|uniref:MCP four helix bundle domain-containing protein n=1 Tax=Paracerasibacillus soli TaxID=480284 RepID=A0ABU5CV02_9BACI|nr:HAMP domain-containing protein [Virgibacillus soli]MDY0409270.1 MCP four helix bundle domain-containing protein [Virgibacillus soli]